MIQPIASRSLPDTEVLYQRKKVTVTPSWLEVKNHSYAVRYIQQLTLQNFSPPRITACIIFIISLALTLWQYYRLENDQGLAALNWALMAVCIVLALVSSFIAFAMASRYKLLIRFTRGPEKLIIERSTKADVLELQEALALAMDWYRNDPESTPEAMADNPEEAV